MLFWKGFPELQKFPIKRVIQSKPAVFQQNIPPKNNITVQNNSAWPEAFFETFSGTYDEVFLRKQLIANTAQKMKLPIKDFFSKYDQIPFTEEILRGKLKMILKQKDLYLVFI